MMALNITQCFSEPTCCLITIFLTTNPIAIVHNIVPSRKNDTIVACFNNKKTTKPKSRVFDV